MDLLRESAQNYNSVIDKPLGVLIWKGKEIPISWLFLAYAFGMVGAQTLAIRGAEKSAWGKLFEKLILGSLLHILGFTKVPENAPDFTTQQNVFWLSSRGTKRESDATAMVGPGKVVRFDIGFIGRGNSEISLDKVSRFERTLELSGESILVETIILVDRIGAGSRVMEMAKDIGGHIVQMSLSPWPQHVAQILHDAYDYECPILKIQESDLESYMRAALDTISLDEFTSYLREE